MKPYCVIGILILLLNNGFAQDRPKQDVHSQRIVASYEIIDGNSTGKYFTVTQYLLDSLGRCHTEIDFDRTPRIIAYRWNTFNGNNKIMVESFVNDKKVELDSFVFENSNRPIKQIITFPSEPNRSGIIEKFSYDPKGRIIRIDATTLTGKKAFRSTYVYDEHGTEINLKVKIKRGFPLDSIVALNRAPSYDSLGRMTKEVVSKKFIDNRSFSSVATYQYDKKGNIAEKQLFDAKGALLYRVEYLYRSDNSLWQEKTYNANGVLIEWLAWRLENIVKGPQGRISVPAQ